MEKKDLNNTTEDVKKIGAMVITGIYDNGITPEMARRALKGIKEIVDPALEKLWRNSVSRQGS